MSTIDIKKNYRQYKPDELRSAAYQGIVYCGSTDLTDFLEYIFQGAMFKEEVDKIVQEARDEWDEDDNSGEYRERIARAISVLEGEY